MVLSGRDSPGHRRANQPWQLTIYPIPGHDVINVILPDDAFLPVRYRITDMQGHTHESGVQNQRDIKLDAGFLPSGIYHVVIMDKSGRRWTGKWAGLIRKMKDGG
ncbi:MAG: T9SS type A sorting domain-containing protein [Saprospiraceae bacterium]|nr:T9SS type A sorting domain-containing protein [Saprospiraceae bacterium]